MGFFGNKMQALRVRFKPTKAYVQEMGQQVRDMERQIKALHKVVEKQSKEIDRQNTSIRLQLQEDRKGNAKHRELWQKTNQKLKDQEILVKRYMDEYFAYSGITRTDREYFGKEAVEYLLAHYEIGTLLDIGSGAGIHSNLFVEAGINVTAIDYGKSLVYRDSDRFTQVVGDFNTYEFDTQFDCLWCCHVLEHQLNPGTFLRRVHGLIKEGGVLALTVPPMKQLIVGGHVAFWNAGLLLYHLVLAGFDCRNAHVKTYGYNISVIVEKHSIDVMGDIRFDRGDLRAIQQYLPEGLEFYPNDEDTPFNGSIKSVNWDEQAESEEVETETAAQALEGDPEAPGAVMPEEEPEPQEEEEPEEDALDEEPMPGK